MPQKHARMAVAADDGPFAKVKTGTIRLSAFDFEVTPPILLAKNTAVSALRLSPSPFAAGYS
jgi:hypothetical protein